MSKEETLTLVTDQHGYLKDSADWSLAIAEIIATRESIEMTSVHWVVVKTLREFYLQHEILPPMRGLLALLREKLSADQNTSLYLQRLFPKGLMRQASKIAGLPKPVRCI